MDIETVRIVVTSIVLGITLFLVIRIWGAVSVLIVSVKEEAMSIRSQESFGASIRLLIFSMCFILIGAVFGVFNLVVNEVVKGCHCSENGVLDGSAP